MPNNRQIAALILIGVFITWIGRDPAVRESMRGIVRQFRSMKLLLPTLAFVAYVSAAVVAGERLQLWTPALATDTGFWFVSTGCVMYLNMNHFGERQHHVRRTVAEALGITVFLEFFLNLYVLPLWSELLLQPLIALFALVPIVATNRPDLAPARRVSEFIVGTCGVLLLIYSIAHLVRNAGHLHWADDLRQLLLPVWLTCVAVPFVYATALGAAYELIAVRMKLFGAGRGARLRGLVAAFLRLGFRTRLATGFAGHWPRQLGHAGSFREARQVVKDYLSERTLEEAEAAEAAQRLARYAGVEGVDADGAQLDRREFRETREALRWLATCQMGWFNQGAGYRSDLLDILTFDDLGEAHGICMEVSADQQCWYAWRRTITGWHLGIGAAGPPPDQWLGEGPAPPDCSPSPSKWWGSGPFGMDAKNWD